MLWRKGGIVRFQRFILRPYKEKTVLDTDCKQDFDKTCLSKSSRLTSSSPIRCRSPLQNAFKVEPIMPGRRFTYGPGGASTSLQAGFDLGSAPNCIEYEILLYFITAEHRFVECAKRFGEKKHPLSQGEELSNRYENPRNSPDPKILKLLCCWLTFLFSGSYV